MKKKVFIVDPSRDSALAFAAVMKHDELQPQVFDDDTPFYEALEDTLPELVVLRAEGKKTSGYAICNRLRGTPKTQGIKTIIITLRGDEQMATHRRSKLAADAYISPPLGLKELRIDALALAGIEGALVDGSAVDAVEEDPFGKLDQVLSEGNHPVAEAKKPEPEAKPRAAPKHDFSDADIDGAFGNIGGPKPPPPPEEDATEDDEPELIEDDSILEVPEAPKMVSPLHDMSDEDLAFVNQTFAENKDRGAPPLPPGIKRKEELQGPDAKLYQLREALREKEQEISRLQQIWQQHEKNFQDSEQLVLEKEIEVKQLRMRSEELKQMLDYKDEEWARKEREFSASCDHLIEEKVLLEKDLIEVVAAKEKVAYEQRRMLAARERDMEDLRIQSNQERVRNDAERTEERASYEKQLAELRTDLARSVEKANSDAEAARAAQDKTATEHHQALSALEQRLAEALLKIDGLEGELTDHKRSGEALQTELTTTKEKLAEREATLVSKDSGLNRLAGEVADLKQQLAAKESALTEVRTDLKSKDERDLQLSTETARLTERLTQSEAALSAARQQHDTDSGALLGQLDAKTKAAEQLQSELGQLRERLTTLESTSTERTQTLLKELDGSKTAHKDMAHRLEQRLNQKDEIIAQKDEMLGRLSKEVTTSREEREGLVQRLSERLSEREATISAREREIAELKKARGGDQSTFDERMKESIGALETQLRGVTERAQIAEARLADTQTQRDRLEKEQGSTQARLTEVQQQASAKLEAQMLDLEQLRLQLRVMKERAANAAGSAPPPAAAPAPPAVQDAADAAEDSLLADVGKKLGS